MNISKIILNKDGSIKLLSLPYSIQQGNSGVDEIDIAIDDFDTSELTAVANFEREDETTTSLFGTSKNISDDDGTTYNGFSFVLTQAETLYEGKLKVSIQLSDINDKVLYSYKTTLTINSSVLQPNEIKITLAQYNSIVKALSSYQQKFVVPNVRYYDTWQDVLNDMSNLATNQVVIYTDDDYKTRIAQKQGEDEIIDLEFLANDISTPYVNSGSLSIKLTDGESYIRLKLVDKDGNQLSYSEITLPLATYSTGGLMSANDKSYFDSIPNKLSTIEQTAKEYTDSKVSTVYRYKGSVETYQDLPSENNEIGDTWNVVEEYESYGAGTNFSWNGTSWDALGGSFALEYMTDGEVHEITGVR